MIRNIEENIIFLNKFNFFKNHIKMYSSKKSQKKFILNQISVKFKLFLNKPSKSRNNLTQWLYK